MELPVQLTRNPSPGLTGVGKILWHYWQKGSHLVVRFIQRKLSLQNVSPQPVHLESFGDQVQRKLSLQNVSPSSPSFPPGLTGLGNPVAK